MIYRKAEPSDIPAMAAIRSAEWETLEYWTRRTTGFLDGSLNPQQALPPRVAYVAYDGEEMIGFIAGHLTHRFNCDGELEWINVIPEHRGTGVASELLRLLAEWFVGQSAKRICVDVGSDSSRRFYAKNGAEPLNPHWMVWNDVSHLAAPHNKTIPTS
jgi:GNAT superfamily N-acetyltransferase